MILKSWVSSLCFVGFLVSANANQSLSVFSSCAKELDGAIKEARAFVARDFLDGKPQYNILVGAPHSVGYEYFKVDYTILSDKPQTLLLEFKFWYDGDDKCHRVEFEDYIY